MALKIFQRFSWMIRDWNIFPKLPDYEALEFVKLWISLSGDNREDFRVEAQPSGGFQKFHTFAKIPMSPVFIMQLPGSVNRNNTINGIRTLQFRKPVNRSVCDYLHKNMFMGKRVYQIRDKGQHKHLSAAKRDSFQHVNPLISSDKIHNFLLREHKAGFLGIAYGTAEIASLQRINIEMVQHFLKMKFYGCVHGCRLYGYK